MAERRSLIEGVKPIQNPVDPVVEKKFVYGDTNSTPVAPVISVSRVPVSTRIREDLAKGLKRASLERQLHGIEPNAIGDIIETALEPWLKSNGYLL